jgi:ketosteroid isomerase-like protein
MYRYLVGRRVRATYAQINRGDWGRVAGVFHPGAVFRCAGDHELGGERHGPDEIRAWFELVGRLFPGLELEPLTVVVAGWPWDTRVCVRFGARAELPDGSPYRNEGMQFLRLRWGRAVEDYVYEDVQKLVAALDRIEASRPGAFAAASPQPEGASG